MSKNDDILLRPARPGDQASLRDILYDTFESTWRPNITRSAAEAFLREERPAAYVQARGLTFQVAEADGAVVGFVDWQGDFVYALHVRPAQARRGIGRRLMDHAETEIAQAGFGTARLETDSFNRRRAVRPGSRQAPRRGSRVG